jgi:hypothetical protein
MASFGEGKIEIPMEEFWAFVNKYHEHKTAELAFGVPKVNKENETMEINYAYGTESNPIAWSVKPKCLEEWK